MFSRSESALRYLLPPHVLLKCCQATAYGRCIFADYTTVQKDMCAKEFMKLKDCYLVIACRLDLLRVRTDQWTNRKPPSVSSSGRQHDAFYRANGVSVDLDVI